MYTLDFPAKYSAKTPIFLEKFETLCIIETVRKNKHLYRKKED